MTWADILSEVKRSLKEKDSGGHWSDAEYLRRANIAQRDVARETGCVKSSSTASSVVGTASYTKPTNCLTLTRVLFNGKPIMGINVEDLDTLELTGSINSPWTGESGTPTNFYETPTTITLYPKPDSVATITYEFDLRPTDLVDGTSVPFNDINFLYDYHDIIIDYILWKCELENRNEIYQEHKQEYTIKKIKLNKQLGNTPTKLATYDLAKPKGGTVNQNNPLPLWNK